MSNEISVKENFETTIKNRLREDIGKLMPDDVLAEYVKRAVEEMFFTKQTKKETNNWNAKTITLPSWFEKAIFDEMKPKMLALVEEYFKENKEELQKQVTECIKEAVPALLAEILTSSLANVTSNISWNISNAINNRLS